ncbi:MAG: DUF5320 domain-containing protein [Bacteroidales bacterium]|nr:DUF5320 domain-containing protein [Bacteroidales bacterium]
MPGRNQTGPVGLGPLTGRRMGNCVGSTNPELISGFGFGRGMRNGFGRGFNQGFGRNYTFSETQNFSNKEAIENEVNMLKEQLSILEKKLENLS